MSSDIKHNLICVIGHTAGGKTGFAARLASLIEGEIISADSRQVYRFMDIGTGKDLDDYIVNGKTVPYHLIDIVDPGYEYNVYEYQRDFLQAFSEISERGKVPILCGGTGLYIEAVLKAYRLINVPPDPSLRKRLELMSHEELIRKLESFKKLHNKTDTENRKRLIRAIEIEEYYTKNPELDSDYPTLNPVILGIRFDRETRRKRITERLKQRLNEGMIEETRNLLEKGISPEKLIYYGLEYKYLTWYVNGKISYDEMFSGLNTAIHRFAKRQMTWFRGMERKGFRIHWIDGSQTQAQKLDQSLQILGLSSHD